MVRGVCLTAAALEPAGPPNPPVTLFEKTEVNRP
jgi:hypothetical protein